MKFEVLSDIRSPILYSIATLRYHEPEIPIYVIDYSIEEPNWGTLPERLGFTVVRQRCGLSEVSFRYTKSPAVGMVPKDDRIFMEHLSRPIDIWNHVQTIEQRYIIYSDSDILWNGSCIPKKLDSEFFHCRKTNTGVFFFDKLSEKAEVFFNCWMGLSMLAAKNRRFRQQVYKETPFYTAIQDEAIFIYIRDKMPELYQSCVKELDMEWNFMPTDYEPHPKQIVDCRGLHTMIGVFSSKRGYLCWLLKEFQVALKQFFTEEEIKRVFSPILDQEDYGLDVFQDGIDKPTQKSRDRLVQFMKLMDVTIKNITIYKNEQP